MAKIKLTSSRASTLSALFYLLVFVILSVLAIKFFSPSIPFFELSTQIIRKHEFAGLTLSLRDTFIFQALNYLYGVFAFLDNKIKFFPSWIITNFWKADTVYFILVSPILITLAWLTTKIKIRYKPLIIILFIIWQYPTGQIFQSISDKVLVNMNFRYALPLSRRFDWVWISDDLGKKDYVARFNYSWNQNSSPQSGNISLSCFGHYRLIVNNRTIGRGPVFAKYPKVFTDSYSIKDEIKLSLIHI